MRAHLVSQMGSWNAVKAVPNGAEVNLERSPICECFEQGK